MIFLRALWAKAWPYLAVIVAAFAAFFGIRQSGKAAARAEDAVKLNETAAKARKEARDVAQKVAALDDDGVDSRLDEWVRGDKNGR